MRRACSATLDGLSEGVHLPRREPVQTDPVLGFGTVGLLADDLEKEPLESTCVGFRHDVCAHVLFCEPSSVHESRLGEHGTRSEARDGCADRVSKFIAVEKGGDIYSAGFICGVGN